MGFGRCGHLGGTSASTGPPAEPRARRVTPFRSCGARRTPETACACASGRGRVSWSGILQDHPLRRYATPHGQYVCDRCNRQAAPEYRQNMPQAFEPVCGFMRHELCWAFESRCEQVHTFGVVELAILTSVKAAEQRWGTEMPQLLCHNCLVGVKGVCLVLPSSLRAVLRR